MNRRVAKFFFVSSAILLLVTGAAKLYSTAGSARILLVIDPLLGITNRHLMFGTGLAELGIGLYLLVGRSDLARGLVVFWLSSNFMFYRVVSELLNVKMCPCLGSLGANLPFSPEQVSNMLMIVVLYIFLGSTSFLLQSWSAKFEQNRSVALRARNSAERWYLFRKKSAARGEENRSSAS